MSNIQKMIRGLSSQNVKRRRNAVHTLYQTASKNPNAILQALPKLLGVVTDRDAKVAIQASELLMRLSKAAPAAFFPHLERLGQIIVGLLEQGAEFEGAYQPYINIVSLIANLGVVDPLRVQPLVPLFGRCLNYPIYRPDHPEKGMRQFYAAIVRAIGLIGRTNPAVVLQLIPATAKCFADTFKYSVLRNEADQRDALRPWAGFTIAEMLKLAPEYVVPAVIRYVNDSNADLKLQIRQMLAIMSGAIERLIPPLLASLADKEKDIRANAVDVLEKFGRAQPEKVVPVLNDCLTGDNYTLRLGALETLANIGAQAPEFVIDAIPRIINALGDESRELRVAAIEALTKIGEKDVYTVKDAIPALVERLDDHDSNVRWVVIGALEKIALKDPSYIEDAIPLIIQCLKDPHDHVRWRAGDACKKLNVDPIEHPRSLRTLLRLENQVKAQPMDTVRRQRLLDLVADGKDALRSRNYPVAAAKARELITALDELHKGKDTAYTTPHETEAYSLDRPRYTAPGEGGGSGPESYAPRAAEPAPSPAQAPPPPSQPYAPQSRATESHYALPQGPAPDALPEPGTAPGMDRPPEPGPAPGDRPVQSSTAPADTEAPPATAEPLARRFESLFRESEPSPSGTTGPAGPAGPARPAPDTAPTSAPPAATAEPSTPAESLAAIARRAVETLARTRAEVAVPDQAASEGAHDPGDGGINWLPTEHMPNKIHHQRDGSEQEPEDGDPSGLDDGTDATTGPAGGPPPADEASERELGSDDAFGDWEFPPWGTGDGEQPDEEAATPEEETETEAEASNGGAKRMARFCRYCGSTIPIGGRFCNKCGKKL